MSALLRHVPLPLRFIRVAVPLLMVGALLHGELGAVEVSPGFVAETIATNLNAATAMAAAPDGRIFIADQTGLLRVWKNGRLLERPALSLHVTDYWERGLIGVALDPEFPRTPHLFLLYVTDRPFVHHVLSRFTIEGPALSYVEGDVIDPASERILLEGDDQAKLGGSVPAGHQGGALRFGADGCLYVSIGEHTAGEPAQRLDTLQGKILRLNSDGSIPGDNPFAARTAGKYRAIYARGVRNSFGIAAQPKTDGARIFFTDVGGSAFEEINELKAGGNYGWPLAEGFSTNTGFVQPLLAYPPIIGQSIVGGLVVPKTQSQWPEKWRGKLVVGDFMKHWVKALDLDAPTNLITLARGLNGPVALELAADGTLLVLNRGAIWRDPKRFVTNAGSLVRIRCVGDGDLASRASVGAAGRTAFVPALGLPVRPGALPRRLTQEDWSQRVKLNRSRSFAVPDNEWHPAATTKSRAFLPTARLVRLTDAGGLVFPPGTVFVREFTARLAVTPGAESLRRVVERRLTVVGEPSGYGVSYRLNNAGDGELIEDGELINLGRVQQWASGQFTNAVLNWWFPAIDDALGPTVMNPSYRPVTAATELKQVVEEDQVDVLAELGRRGWLDTNGAAPVLARIPAGALWSDPKVPLVARVRQYLHANCSVCHQPGGASRGNFDARVTTPLPEAGLINVAPVAGDLGIVGAKLIRPGDPQKSILYQRLKRTDFFRMPPVVYHEEPSPILPVLAEWIRSMGDDR